MLPPTDVGEILNLRNHTPNCPLALAYTPAPRSPPHLDISRDSRDSRAALPRALRLVFQSVNKRTPFPMWREVGGRGQAWR